MPSARPATAAPRRQSPARRRVAGPPRRRSAPQRIRWDKVGRISLIIVLAVVAALYVQQGLAYLSVRSQANHQKAIVQQLVKQNAELTRQAAALRNPATIRRDARALGMIRPGERPYVITGLPEN